MCGLLSSHTMSDEHKKSTDLSESEISALHEVELGIEHLHRAHGHLIAFHHSTGRAMNHLAAGEEHFRETDYETLADEIRDEYLPRGVIEGRESDDRGRWSYDVLETYEEVFLNDIVDFWRMVSETVADGQRHVHERRQEQEWKDRSRRD